MTNRACNTYFYMMYKHILPFMIVFALLLPFSLLDALLFAYFFLRISEKRYELDIKLNHVEGLFGVLVEDREEKGTCACIRSLENGIC